MTNHTVNSRLKQIIKESLLEMDLSPDNLCSLLGLDINNTNLSTEEVNALLAKAKADTVRAGRAQRIVQPNYDQYNLSYAEKKKIADYYMYLYAVAMGKNYENAATEINDDMPQRRKDSILQDREIYRDRYGREVTKDTPNHLLQFSPMTHSFLTQGEKVGYKYSDDSNSLILGVIVGKNRDIFMVSHFAPTSAVDGGKALKTLGGDAMPAVLMVTENLAQMLRKLSRDGWVDTGIKIPIDTNFGRAVKYVFVNRATTDDDILDAFVSDTDYSYNLHQSMTQAVNKFLTSMGYKSISQYDLLRMLKSGKISGKQFVEYLRKAMTYSQS